MSEFEKLAFTAGRKDLLEHPEEIPVEVLKRHPLVSELLECVKQADGFFNKNWNIDFDQFEVALEKWKGGERGE